MSVPVGERGRYLKGVRYPPDTCPPAPNTSQNSSCGKVEFSQVSVSHSVQGSRGRYL